MVGWYADAGPKGGSNDVREVALEFSEVVHPEEEKDPDYPERDQLPWPKERGAIAKHAPAKTVNYADHRI